MRYIQKNNCYKEVIAFPYVKVLLIQKNKKTKKTKDNKTKQKIILHRLQQKTVQSRLGPEICCGIPGSAAPMDLQNNK
jgi:hypothetical protein